jgi:hypothetical protein
MKRIELLIVAALSSSVLGAAAADVYVYPAKGQTKDQQQRDEFDCYKWAKDRTGFDPSQPAAPAGSSAQPKGQVVRGAAGGAAVGAVGGAIGGNAGKGAAIGAGVGATAGAVRRHRARKEAETAQNQQSAASRDGYNRAYSACMSGRGYTVK